MNDDSTVLTQETSEQPQAKAGSSAATCYAIFDYHDEWWLVEEGRDDAGCRGFGTSKDDAILLSKAEAEQTLHGIERTQFGIGIEPCLKIVRHNASGLPPAGGERGSE